MTPRIVVQFLEKEFFSDPKTGTVKGYNPARIRTKEGIVHGRALDIRELAKTESLEVVLFETELDLVDQTIDLAGILRTDENGAKWLDAFLRYFNDNYDAKPTTEFKIEQLPFVKLEYTKYPNDYFKRGRGYRPPRGLVHTLVNAHFVLIRSPMKFLSGEWISVNYKRKVARPDGIVESYSTRPVVGEYMGGSLLGELTEHEIEITEGDFECDFPLNHFQVTSYPVSIRQLRKYNPLSIRVGLKK